MPGGQQVRWGGEIINVEPRADATCFEVLSRELYSDARPSNHRDRSDGRFVCLQQGFLRPGSLREGTRPDRYRQPQRHRSSTRSVSTIIRFHK